MPSIPLEPDQSAEYAAKRRESPMSELMGHLDKGLKSKGMTTSREGNRVTVESFGSPAKDTRYMGKMSVGSEKDLTPEERKRVSRDMPMEPVKKYAKGGTASSRADGIAKRGKTRGTIVMCKGGRAK